MSEINRSGQTKADLTTKITVIPYIKYIYCVIIIQIINIYIKKSLPSAPAVFMSCQCVTPKHFTAVPSWHHGTCMYISNINIKDVHLFINSKMVKLASS